MMKFEEAIRTFKKVRKKGRTGYYCLNGFDREIYYHRPKGIPEKLNSVNLVSELLINSNEWEVFDDDANWNLANNSDSLHSNLGEGWRLESIKKCRELIIKDILDSNVDYPNKTKKIMIDIVKERFGDI